VNFSRDPLGVCRILGLGLFCLCLLSSLAASSAQDGREAGRSDVAAVADSAADATGAHAAGSRIYIDPATGRRTTPPAAAEGDAVFRAPAVPLAALRSERRSDGTVGVRLHGNFRSYSVATVSPAGVVTQDCFDDAEAAAAALRTAAPHAGVATEAVR
jgi:hypothetical protein